jgi:hypothetical protein
MRRRGQASAAIQEKFAMLRVLWRDPCSEFLLMRTLRSIAATATLAACAAVIPAQAGAQSLFQKLFGFGSAGPAPAPPRSLGPSLRDFGRAGPYGSYDPFGPIYPQSYAPSSYGAYRTLCDGYYFPMSSGVSGESLSRDAERCEQSCAGDARLFYLPRGSDNIANMTDTTGRVYGRLPNAFLYRKKLVNGCGCKPMPWSQAEIARHRHYALIEILERQQSESPVPVSGSEAQSVTQQQDQSDDVPVSVTEVPFERSSTSKPVKLASASVSEPAATAVSLKAYGGAMHPMPSAVLTASERAGKSPRQVRAQRKNGPSQIGFSLFGPGGLFSSGN